MKDLISPQWLRNIKDKNILNGELTRSFQKKHNDDIFVNDGGWHFTNMKTPE